MQSVFPLKRKPNSEGNSGDPNAKQMEIKIAEYGKDTYKQMENH